MRIALPIIIALHGLIHLLGFLKAFEIVDLKELTPPISRPFGILYLAAFLLFTTTAVLYAAKQNFWWIAGIAAVILSQVLIISFWKDARFGTLPNVLILIACIIGFFYYKFNSTVRLEVNNMIAAVRPTNTVVTEESLSGLPKPVRPWLHNSRIVGRARIQTVFLKQKCLMKMKPGQEDWYEAVAEQFYAVDEPAFIWTVSMNMLPMIEVVGRDKFSDGRGEMLIRLLSMVSVVNEKDNPKIDQGALQRYLGEMVWFPSGAISPYVTWERIDETTAKATLSYKGTTGSGVFSFDDNGNVRKFSALRYMGSDDKAERREWIIEATEHKIMDGVKVPANCQATWKLDDGDWTWAIFEVTEIHYNWIDDDAHR